MTLCGSLVDEFVGMSDGEELEDEKRWPDGDDITGALLQMMGICSGENNGCDDRIVFVDCDVCVNSSEGTVAGKRRGRGA